MLINPFVTRGRFSFVRESRADLFRTSLLPQCCFNRFPGCRRNPRFDFAALSSLRQLPGFVGAVAAPRTVPFQFASKGGFVDAQGSGDSRLRPPRVDLIPLLRNKMLILQATLSWRHVREKSNFLLLRNFLELHLLLEFKVYLNKYTEQVYTQREQTTMPNSEIHEVTQLLLAWNEGNPGALDRLMPLMYDELHRMARRYMRQERVGHTLQATALINEAYVRLIDAQAVQWQNRAHFLGIAAQLMRRILVDFARERGYQKRGGGAQQVSLEEALIVSAGLGEDFVVLDEALSALSALDQRKGRVVEMRFFAGLTEKEIAEVLSISEETVRRDWRFAKTWLRRYLTEGPPRER